MRRVLGILVACAGIAVFAVPAFAQVGPAEDKAEFKFGFGTIASLAPVEVGEPLHNEVASPNGDTHQATTRGLMVWRKADNVAAFTNGTTTLVLGPLGLQARSNTERFEWEKADVVGGVKLRGDGTVDDNSAAQSGSDDIVGGVKLRGDGTVDDSSASHSGLDDMVNGVNLRGDGTVDDNLPQHSGLDDMVNGVNVRGDGTVDDGGVSGRDASRTSDDSGSSSSGSRSSDDSGSRSGDDSGSRSGDDRSGSSGGDDRSGRGR